MSFKNLVIFVLLTAPVMVGCGKDASNPTKGYSMKTVPIHGLSQPGQEEGTSPFQIDILGENDVNFANFAEGQEGTVKFAVRILESDVTAYDLVPISVPAGATFKRSSDDPNVWILKWTPPMGDVPSSRAFKKYPVVIEGRVVSTLDPRLLNFVDHAKSFEITVNKTQEMPSIIGVNGFKSELNEGEALSFSVDVQDSTTTQFAPALIASPYNQAVNLENFKTDGSSYVSLNPGQAVIPLKSKTWRYNFVFDTRFRDLPRPLNRAGHVDLNAEGINVCVVFQARSSLSGNSAPEKLACLYLRYASQTPEIVFDDPNPVSTLVAGQINSVKFTARTPNKRGEVSLQNTTVGFTTWPGNPKLNCSDGTTAPSVRTCEISWEVPCQKLNSHYVFAVQATNHVGAILKKAQGRREIRIQSDRCPVPKPVTIKPVSPVAKPVSPVAEKKQGLDQKGSPPVKVAKKPQARSTGESEQNQQKPAPTPEDLHEIL